MAGAVLFQAEDGIRDLVRSCGLGDVYKRQVLCLGVCDKIVPGLLIGALSFGHLPAIFVPAGPCLLYTSDAADDLLRVDLGGRRIIEKKKHNNTSELVRQVAFTDTPLRYKLPLINF